MGRWSLGQGWVCPRCGSADVRVLDGWLSRWWSRIWRLLVWGTALAALLYCTRP